MYHGEMVCGDKWVRGGVIAGHSAGDAVDRRNDLGRCALLGNWIQYYFGKEPVRMSKVYAVEGQC
jgi:hypothetical protein